MITIEFRINGALIGHIYAVREKPDYYRWECYIPDENLLVGDNLKHHQSEGALKLAKRLITAADKKREETRHGKPRHYNAR